MAQWRTLRGLTARQMLDLPPVWLLGCIGLVWIQAALWPAGTWTHPILRALGAVLFWAGIALMIWAILAFRTHQTSVIPHQTPSRIITTGPFARTRNPIYLGDLMVLSGVILNKGAWPAVILLPLFAMILVRRFIAPEETRMKQSFGTDFGEYAEKTPRWL